MTSKCADFRAQMRIQDYSQEQGAHVFDKTRRAASVPPIEPKWTPSPHEHAGSSHSLALVMGDKSDNISDVDSSDRLRHYFAATLKNKRCPQRGKMTPQTQHGLAVRREERLMRLQSEREVSSAPCFDAL